ncbi:MAG: hypothetical protein IIA87_05020 [Nanoarchaeota archaeon]|nr:hypothetical protein [Nanoarchaeota archaeon]
MVAEVRPTTLTRIGLYEESLEHLLKEFNPNLRPSMSVLGNTNQYMLYEEQGPPYLLVVSHAKEGEHPEHKYNTIVTITSEDAQRNKDVIRDFESKTGLNLREAPKSLQDHFELLSMCFPIFKRHGQKAIKLIQQR